MYIYIPIYICAVELKAGPRFGFFCVKSCSKSCVKAGPRMLRNKMGPVFNTTTWSFFVVFVFIKQTHPPPKKKMDQFLTQKRAKIRRAFNSTIYIYIYCEGSASKRLPKTISGRVNVSHYLTICWNSRGPVGNIGGADCIAQRILISGNY